TKLDGVLVRRLEPSAGDGFGHYWIEIDGKGYGWWPKGSAGWGDWASLVPGELNAGYDEDPHSREVNPDIKDYHVYVKGFREYDRQMKNNKSAIIDRINNVASSYADWGNGLDCRSFQNSIIWDIGCDIRMTRG